MYVYQSASGFELDILTSNLNDEKLREAIQSVTGERFPMKSYATRAEAEAVKSNIYTVYRSF